MGWLGKERLAGEKLTTTVGLAVPVGLAGGAVAVPERLTVWVPPLSEMLTIATRLPLASGVNVTAMVQLLPTPTELPQLLV